MVATVSEVDPGARKGARIVGAVLTLGMGGVLAGILWSAAHPGSFSDEIAHLFFRGFCHQNPERSFAWGGHAFCVCHRCFGVYAGLAGGGLLAIAGLRADVGKLRLWVAATLPMVVHVALLQIIPAVDQVWLRVATGAVFGLWSSWAVALGLGSLWSDTPAGPPERVAVPAPNEERT
ncbi:MAG: hypothetical protein CMN31_05075 [Sandaracinus sp.]|nr:hypothetical protein [Myxococcales bacterium]MAT28917.1 hypothetical protein [Sandaracinus sp.]MBJ70703.1 hypothetical protein [Sandaracinus sp.]